MINFISFNKLKNYIDIRVFFLKIKMGNHRLLVMFLIILQIITLTISSEKYNLKFEYLTSENTLIYELELFNRPKNALFDYGEDIFYSGKIESIENYPISKLVNFNKTELEEKIQKRQYPFLKIINDNVLNDKKENKENKEVKKVKTEQIEKSKTKYEMPKEINKIPTNSKVNRYQDNIEEKSIFDYLFNDYDFYQNKKYQTSNQNQNQKKRQINNNNNNNNKNNYYNNFNNNYFNNNYFNNYNHNNNNNNQQQQQEQYNRNNIHIIHNLNNNNGPTIRIIRYPNSNTYTIYKNYNNDKDYTNQNKKDYKNNNNNYYYNNKNNNNNYNKKYNNKNNGNIHYKYNRDPFSLFNDFDFENPFEYLESTLSEIYGIRFLEEKHKKELYSNLFLPYQHSLLYIPNQYYFDYIQYLPKSTIILVPQFCADQLIDYEDYYIFIVPRTISIPDEVQHYVKIGKDFNDSTFISIILLTTILICFVAAITYSFLLKKFESNDILPVQQLSSLFPIFLLILNILVYLSFLASYYKTEVYLILTKNLSLFLYSFFKSIFISVQILLLNGWMTLSFNGWGNRINILIPIILLEVISSIYFELEKYNDTLPYNKIQLYYMRNILENIIIISLSLMSLYKYYFPLIQKCKYLSLINSSFTKAYKLKKKKLLSFIIFSLFYSVISIYSNYLEYPFIYKYIQNDLLHTIKQFILESIFVVIFIIILLPMELPYLFKEETDLDSFGYFFTNLNDKNEILDINSKNMKEIKKEAGDKQNIPIIVVNPFFNDKNGFDNLHVGKVSIE